MSEKRISHCQGKGSLTHNNRKFNAKNVDDTRTKDNIVFVQQPTEEAYQEKNAVVAHLDEEINAPYSNADHYRPCQEAECRREQGERADRRDCKAEKGERRSCRSF